MGLFRSVSDFSAHNKEGKNTDRSFCQSSVSVSDSLAAAADPLLLAADTSAASPALLLMLPMLTGTPAITPAPGSRSSCLEVPARAIPMVMYCMVTPAAHADAMAVDAMGAAEGRHAEPAHCALHAVPPSAVRSSRSRSPEISRWPIARSPALTRGESGGRGTARMPRPNCE